jgi:hypothetical protein
MDALDRMFHVLVRTLRERNPALLDAPFTVGELHSQILPYRHFRRELGLQSNQEYELVLLELLTGARGYLEVDERMRGELAKELVSSAPEPARVRDFAEAQVLVSLAAQSQVPEAAPAQPQGAAAQRKPTMTTPAPVTRPTCRYCAQELPLVAGRPINYCPHCGQNLQVLNCPACGAEVEAAWRFCVACGKAVT